MQLCKEMRFYGKCREALDVYENAFSSKCELLVRYRDALGENAPEGTGEYVWHAEMHVGGVRFMLSDEAKPGEPPLQPVSGCAVSFSNPGELFRAYYALLPGARDVNPLREEPFSECIANLIDRFGMRWGLLLERPENAPMTAPLTLLKPSQLYVSQKKLADVDNWLLQKGISAMEPLPVKLMGGVPVLTDGHTRALALYRAGITEAPICWEKGDWDYDAIAKARAWCAEEGIDSVKDLSRRVLSAEEYQILWNERCEREL